MNTLEFTGGARIGNAQATWPFAVLKVTKERLELNASIIGNLVFQPKDIVSLVPHNGMGRGLKINHRVPNYNNEVIFWTPTDPATLIHQINQTGFFEKSSNKKDDPEIIEQQQSGSFPIKKSIAIGVVVGWNILFLSDFIISYNSGKKGMPVGNGATLAIGALLLFSILVLISNDFRVLVLKKGKTLQHVDRFLYFLILISGFMLMMMMAFRNIEQ